MIFKLFDELKNLFTKQEENLVQYIKENLEEAKKLNAYELAEKAKISQPTVIRFAKKLGYKGFADFRIAMNKENLSQKTILHQQISLEDNMLDATNKILTLNKEAITGVMDFYEEESYKEVIKLLDSAEKIMIFGVGGSGLVAKDFAYKLSKIGKQIYCEADIQTQIANLNNFTKKDVFFAISYTGESKEVLKAVSIAKKCGIPIVSLTRYIPNSLSLLSNINLKTSANEETFRISSITSRIAQLSVIDILFINMIKENYEKYMPIIKLSKELVNEYNE